MDKIAKQRLNIIMLADCSKSMQGERISQVNQALRDIKNYLIELENENSNVDFYITVIPFSTEASYLNNQLTTEIKEFEFNNIKAGGWSNLHLAYSKLTDILKKESQGGIMPDFGGVAPIILLMTDGHPTKYPLKEEMRALKALPWYNVALKYGIAIDLKDARTYEVLREFVDGNGDVVECLDSKMLKNIIKIIVLTASKVKSTSSAIRKNKTITVVEEIKQQVQNALTEVDDWEW